MSKPNPSWYDPDAKPIDFIRSKRFGFGFDPSDKERPFSIGEEGLFKIGRMPLPKEVSELRRAGGYWLLEYINKFERGEDFSLDDLLRSAEAQGQYQFPKPKLIENELPKPKEDTLNTPWLGLLGIILITPILCAVFAQLVGFTVFGSGGWIDGLLYGALFGFCFFLLLFVCRWGASGKWFLSYVLITALVIYLGGILVEYETSAKTIADDMAAKGTLGELTTIQAYNKYLKELRGEDASIGLQGHIAMLLEVGVYSMEKESWRGRQALVHRDGFWLVIGWTLQFLSILSGIFLGAMIASGMVTDKQERN